jgi:hypothetical protein
MILSGCGLPEDQALEQDRVGFKEKDMKGLDHTLHEILACCAFCKVPISEGADLLYHWTFLHLKKGLGRFMIRSHDRFGIAGPGRTLVVGAASRPQNR